MPVAASNREVLSAQSPESLHIFLNFATRLIEQTTVEELLWFVAEEVVEKLGFIDCVLYRVDHERGVLCQAAAIGDKTPQRRRIANTLEIPLGQGVTGTVARTGRSILLSDVAPFPSYIPDLIEPGSELCVPILHDGKVLGVIDSEHPDKNRFSENHLEIFRSVASLTATQWIQCDLMKSLVDHAARLMEAERRADEANKAKSVFLANMSHEIRTPLHGLLSAANLLQDTKLDERQRQYCNILNSSSGLLLQLIEDVLDLTKIESGECSWQTQQFDMRSTTNDAVNAIAQIAKTKGLQTEVSIAEDLPASIISDPKRISQVMINFLGNATKFSDQGSVRCIVRLSGTDYLRVEVQDDGPGLSEEECSRIFQRFERADRAVKLAITGSGVGLALSKEIIEYAGGKIGVLSSLGGGATFWFEVPIKIPEEYDQTEPSEFSLGTSQSKEENQTLNILVVDDNEVNRLVAVAMFTSENFTVETANDGQEALSMIEKTDYDAVLLDLRMPVLCGEGLLEILRAPDSSYQELPVYILSGDVTNDIRNRVLSKGANAFFSKPIILDEVIRKIRADLPVTAEQN